MRGDIELMGVPPVPPTKENPDPKTFFQEPTRSCDRILLGSYQDPGRILVGIFYQGIALN